MIKISDFGTATVFRFKGETFVSNTRCGTVPYMAPEVFAEKYYQPDTADLWSCGIILVALLCGELPWDEPSTDDSGYRNWLENKYFESPWVKLDNLALCKFFKHFSFLFAF